MTVWNGAMADEQGLQGMVFGYCAFGMLNLIPRKWCLVSCFPGFSFSEV
jgi:hypothetical protein